jgi:hypothetical protein
MYRALGAALCSGLVTSAMLPAPRASAGLNAKPLKNRRMQSVHMF